ncbi:recQ-mediated genome instability protein 1 [Dunckerocampus dactyliophorus]|uniref:recQ-mediated genome instability protein 1 n=1 Tax=Dunckerocampus dactyliophorus TaxID=161453 RepID=UPI0024051D05|nr:recQ-mediated genome instability protein 1 [Dunckerocampus dactyliophorus]XP_054630676.1 recQ-mediated genome instability protein 1 [Dunckerocampus dactyliophorus]
MAPQAAVQVTQAWLQSSWHVKVPFAWLEACVEWLQEEAGGAGRLSQQQINQQVLDQWLLTDLKDLDYPVLPEGLSQAQKTELSGVFCVQVDSLLDISQPAYGQLQKWKGTDCSNDDVSAVTQTTQRPWEARPTRMLLLQVTDGVQSLEAMEYQPVPALSTALRPGVKLQLQGQMFCRLGMLLLGPSNVKVLGGEVEEMSERNNQGRVLCRTLGLPEEQEREEEVGADAHQSNQADATNQGDLELDDQELLASLEAQEEAAEDMVNRLPVRPPHDSGYRTLSQFSSQSSRSSTVRSVSSRSEASSRPNTSAFSSFQSRRPSNEQEDYDLVDPRASDHVTPADEDFPDEDFDELTLEELDSVVFQGGADVERGHDTATSQNRECVLSLEQDVGDIMEDDLDCCLVEAQSHEVELEGAHSQLRGNEIDAFSIRKCEGSHRAVQGESHASSTAERNRMPPKNDPITLSSPPFTYLCLLEDIFSTPQPPTSTKVLIKAFIVTLLGKLSANNGLWRICATVSDGSGYLDVELSDQVLTGLLGFSVSEKGAMRRDPARRGELDAGMRRCQQELVDMCCLMTIEVVAEGGRRAVVTRAEPVSERVHRGLEERVRDGRK